ncbi:DNA-directed RNA polymerase subunit beta' [Romboutsia ilealis]|uniref:DNA-directed RNA polymerase subunit beta' n=2 Tax=Peptostreptococcaceae TaxID=186804 RepID=A0ABR7JT74_9FIRM|nr:DNA-directed RNA polymerase subunit beta' [Romboutsia faecis]MBC5998111.1 DNA-directed RNA polymerase subunit beta' [Romboutsia faecis]MRN26200.1 DNA-directed RNA polymerase subunit beta' [Romboutsia ilealis]
MFELNNFESIKIALASPEKIREWSRGEVKKPETINYRTLKPEKDGLFCERIFGPQKDWECHCGKYRRVRYKGVVCDRCGVEVTKAKVRRERMGHIELAAPMSHIWYFKGIPSRMGLLLDMSPRSLEKILYFASYVVINPGETGLNAKQLLTEKEYRSAVEKYGYNSFEVGMGAEAVKELLRNIDLERESKELRADLKDSTGQKRVRTIRRLEVVEAFKKSGNKPEWMILDAIPVIPPDLRPMVQLDGGRFATSDLNDLYRRVINRNNRLKRLLELGAPDIIVRNEKRMLQEAVDALIDNGRRGRPVTGPGNRPLKSLSDMLKGKQGRFRQNLLGKRVDYSGRSVIVVGPELKFYQCGLPKKMALELFKPFVMDKLVKEGYAHNIKSAKSIVEKVKPEVWDVLEDVIKSHPVLLNRAPTLHRLGIQAFEPILVEGKAIKLHPLVCTAYNADFDGDQMAVHVPLSVEAQAEARFLMLSVNNILAPKDGTPITTPSQDMVLGCYYLTIEAQGGEKGTGIIFKDYNEMLLAYQTGAVELHALVKMRVVLPDGRKSLVESTVGRFIFNENIPQNLGFVDREVDPFGLEVDFLVDKKSLGKIIDKCFRKHGNTETAILLDHIKALGFRFSTRGGITVAVADMKVPDAKAGYLKEAEEKVDKYERAYRRGLISNEERYERVIETWSETTDKVTDALMEGLERLNNIYIMAHSGARGSKNQIRQLAGMRGLMANASGKTVEVPVKSNFREGLSVMEYFTSSHGARKGLADTALRTADSGYLTRRLVDVSQDVIVREIDCGTIDTTEIVAIKDGNEVIEELYDRIVGRYTIDAIVNPQTGEVLVEADAMILEDDADKIIAAGIEKVEIRTVLNCKTTHGVCSKCYGRNLATGKEVNIGEAVGIIAAQSIGEPGTQLTMRTFHTGGVAGGDITQGLPRVEELFEARKPKGLAIITEISGRVEIDETGKRKEVVIVPESGENQVYAIPYGSRIRVKQGQMVEAGDPLTQGSINPHDIVRVQGIGGVQEYIVKEVQRVYRMQGVDVNDKHIEVIVRQMLSKVKVEDPGDTDLLPGGYEDVLTFNKCNEEAIANGLRPATAKRSLLGITKASLATESFLSAASFQETTRVLTEAAIKGKEDRLIGLKENVILGKLIPAGTGMKRYKNIAVEKIQD